MFKKSIKKVCLTALAAVLAFTGINGHCLAKSKSEPIHMLDVNKTYYHNLDLKGEKEKISFTFKDQVLKVKINDKTKKTIKYNDDSLYEAHIQVLDIDKSDGYMNLWIYVIGSSDDISASELYAYKGGKLKKLYADSYRTPNEVTNISYGYISRTDGKGKFYICYDRAFMVDYLIGNHLDGIPYQLKKDKVTKIKTTSYPIEMVFTEDGTYQLSKKTKFYSSPKSKAKVSMTLSKGKTVKPIEIYNSGTKLCVKFKADNGKIGWLYASDYSYDNMGPFKTIPMFD